MSNEELNKQMPIFNAVTEALDIFNSEYGSKFEVNDKRIKIWCLMLRDFEPQIIINAAYHMAATMEWPPQVAELRLQCVKLSAGNLEDPTGAEAWANIIAKMANSEIKLSDLEQAALRQISTIYDLKRSSNPSTDRAHFIKAFDLLVAKRNRARQTLPEVKALAKKQRLTLQNSKNIKHLGPKTSSDE